MNTIRIIGGLYRGKKINFPEVTDLRPTPDRVRETLFNWLMNDIRNARCLDAFAGSGALGFEALSRSAAEVVMIESSAIAFQSLKRTAEAFKKTTLQILNVDARDHLQMMKTPYDIIFLDPPFNSDCLTECLHIISEGQCLTAKGLIYLESAHEINLDPTQWTVRKSKKAGQVFYALIEKSG